MSEGTSADPITTASAETQKLIGQVFKDLKDATSREVVAEDERLFFPHGIELIYFKFEVGITEKTKLTAEVKIAGEKGVHDNLAQGLQGIALRASAAPFLVAMNARFHTRNDDKDHDTSLAIALVKADHTVVAARSGILGTFPDGSTVDFDVPVTDMMTLDEVTGSATTLNIRTVGNDTWRFDYHLTLRFSDGSRVERDFNNKVLDQDVREATYPL